MTEERGPPGEGEGTALDTGGSNKAFNEAHINNSFLLIKIKIKFTHKIKNSLFFLTVH